METKEEEKRRRKKRIKRGKGPARGKKRWGNASSMFCSRLVAEAGVGSVELGAMRRRISRRGGSKLATLHFFTTLY